MSARVRLPLVEVTDQTRAELAAVLAQVSKLYAEDMVEKYTGIAQYNRRAAVG